MRAAPVHRSLHRPPLVMGADRELVLTSALFCFLMGFGGMSAFSVGSALLAWLFILYMLRRMAKADPQMCRIWLRHVAQQPYYLAHATPWQTRAWKNC